MKLQFDANAVLSFSFVFLLQIMVRSVWRNNHRAILCLMSKSKYSTRFAISILWPLNELKTNKSIMLAAVAQNGEHYLPFWPEADKQMVLLAVSQNGMALFHASHEMKSNKEVVLAAVKQAGCSLINASAKLKRDKFVVKTAGYIKYPNTYK